MGLLKTLLDTNAYSYTLLDDSMFTSCGANCRSYDLGAVSITSLQRLKASLVWTSCTPSPTLMTAPPTDFDLVMTRPSYCGGTVQSVAMNNEVEMVYDACLRDGFAPRGTYQYSFAVRIKNGASIATSCGTSEPIGFAWSVQ